ncbi:hypothetical protein [Thiolapillus sp.]|uniref:hypothetical protein n=1 Tax=Thiolapillus sp. TaxID=2017437 RepID=UPI003AF44D14
MKEVTPCCLAAITQYCLEQDIPLFRIGLNTTATNLLCRQQQRVKADPEADIRDHAQRIQQMLANEVHWVTRESQHYEYIDTNYQGNESLERVLARVFRVLKNGRGRAAHANHRMIA